MTLLDNETSQSSEATATLTAPEGSTQNSIPEPGTHAVHEPHPAPEPAPAALVEAKAEAAPATHDEAGAEDFATALENYESAAAAAEPEESADRLIKGTVVKITATHVVVDFGAKSEGVVPIAEVQDHTGTLVNPNSIVALDGPVEAESSQPPAERVLAGAPELEVRNFFTDGTQQFFAGRWSATRGKWRVRYTENELCVMTAGRVVIENERGERRSIGFCPHQLVSGMIKVEAAFELRVAQPPHPADHFRLTQQCLFADRGRRSEKNQPGDVLVGVRGKVGRDERALAVAD